MKVTARKEYDVSIVELEGEADLAAVPVFQQVMQAEAKARTRRVVVDFSKVTFVNTPIWAVVVEHYQHATEKGTELAVAGLNGRVEASFNIVRLGDFIDAFPTVPEAAAAKK